MSYPDLRAALDGLLGALPYYRGSFSGKTICAVCSGKSPDVDEDDTDVGGELRVAHEPRCPRPAAERTAWYHEVPFHEREDLLRAVETVVAREVKNVSAANMDRICRAVLAALDVRVRCRPPA